MSNVCASLPSSLLNLVLLLLHHSASATPRASLLYLSKWRMDSWAYPKLGLSCWKKRFFIGAKRSMENMLFSSACAIYLHTHLGVKVFFGKHCKKKLFNLNKRLTLTVMFWFRICLKGSHYLAAHFLLLRDWRFWRKKIYLQSCHEFQPF